jgi:hypothetical protein
VPVVSHHFEIAVKCKKRCLPNKIKMAAEFKMILREEKRPKLSLAKKIHNGGFIQNALNFDFFSRFSTFLTF